MGTTDRDQYLLDNVLAAEGIARSSILREEIGAACFNAHAHIILGRTKFCQPGYGSADQRISGSAGYIAPALHQPAPPPLATAPTKCVAPRRDSSNGRTSKPA